MVEKSIIDTVLSPMLNAPRSPGYLRKKEYKPLNTFPVLKKNFIFLNKSFIIYLQQKDRYINVICQATTPDLKQVGSSPMVSVEVTYIKHLYPVVIILA